MTQSQRRVRSITAAVVGVVTVLLLLVTVVGWWAVAVVFDEDEVAAIAVDTVTDPAFVADVSRAIVDDALELIDAAATVGEAARDALAEELAELLSSPVVGEVVHDIVVAAHRGAVHVLVGGELVPGVTVEGDAVVVNVLPLWATVLELATDVDLPDLEVGGDSTAQLVALEEALNVDLADDAGQVVLFRSGAVGEASSWVDLGRRIISAVRRGLVAITLAGLVGTALTVLLARRRRRSGAVLAVGVIASCLATVFVTGRVVGASTNLVSDPALAVVLHGCIDQVASRLVQLLWWTAAAMALLTVVLLPRRRRAPSLVSATEPG